MSFASGFFYVVKKDDKFLREMGENVVWTDNIEEAIYFSEWGLKAIDLPKGTYVLEIVFKQD
jgi:hypothetical protein